MNAALLLFALAAQGEAAPGDKEAREAIHKAAAALKKLESAAYSITWHLPTSATRFEARVQMRRPSQARIEGAFKAPNRHDPVLYVFDGAEEYCIDINDNRYYRRPQVMNGLYSTWEDANRLLYFDGPFTRWMEFATDFRTIKEEAAPPTGTVIEWRIRYTGDVRWRMHLDEAYGIRRIEKYVGHTLFVRIEYEKFESNPRLGDDLFRIAPAPGAQQRRRLEEYGEKLIAVGAEAPDFECLDTESRPVKVSAWKGKPVLFISWSFP
jgi:outer membrane lipoprotein-sorting protein